MKATKALSRWNEVQSAKSKSLTPRRLQRYSPSICVTTNAPLKLISTTKQVQVLLQMCLQDTMVLFLLTVKLVLVRPTQCPVWRETQIIRVSCLELSKIFSKTLGAIPTKLNSWYALPIWKFTMKKFVIYYPKIPKTDLSSTKSPTQVFTLRILVTMPLRLPRRLRM